MTDRIQKGSLSVAKELYDFIENEALQHAGIDSSAYWSGVEQIFKDFTPRNKALLEEREEMQAKIDEWHKANPATAGKIDASAYKSFLKDIGYIVPEGGDFSITTQNVDPEIATIAGPQLVVPVRNARFGLNAANARWGSLYDALYGTDVIPEEEGNEQGVGYNPERGAKVITYAKNFLNDNFALDGASYFEVTGFTVEGGALVVHVGDKKVSLKEAAQFAGFKGNAAAPEAILLTNHGLHAEIQIDADSVIGRDDLASIKDVLMESALTTIQDCEDSVAAVDAEEKTEVYRNWLGLMVGDLSITFKKGDKTITRTMNPDRTYNKADGSSLTLPGRSLMLIRNVGHLMTNPAILIDGEEVFEGIMDAVITPMLSICDIKHQNTLRNSKTGSMYIVKPKQHGPKEVQFSVDLFAKVEELLGLPVNTLKMGIMDEERRTTVNLKECIRVAKDRTIFINTGFMDRTGDEIHTSMHAGAMVPKSQMKAEPWLDAYENWNVDVGVACGLKGKAQIGKGMWPKPDSFKEMMTSKLSHPKAGATCAWVPSPTGATLHALHYHMVNVMDVLEQVKTREHASLDDIITIPLATHTDWSDSEVQNELDNNCQGILGYVVRWVDQGVGCSKVPDIHNVGLMEDRATLRISSQHVTNWLTHGVVTTEQVNESLKRMALIVDEQNAGDKDYVPMAPSFDGLAFNAAKDLIFKGDIQPSGYTEPLLHAARLELKAS